jgi:hypothetical protein
MIIGAFASLASGATWSNEQVATNPGALTEQADSAFSTYLSLAIADGLQSTAGATGVSTSTMSGTAGNNAGALVSLRPIILPTATTGAATLIATSSATGNGNITNTGYEYNDIRGFVYGTTSTSTTPGNIAPTSTIYASYAEDAGSYGTGAFTKALTSLATSTTYYMRAYSHNSLGWSYGAEVSFTTLSLPTVTTQSASDVAVTTATGNGNITSIGGENNNIRGFVYGTSTQSLPGNVAPTSTSYTSYAQDVGSYTTGAFTKALTSLTSGATYYIRAYSHNTTGYAYGGETQFTTSKPIVEFVAIVDPDSGAGTDFSSLFAWEAATQVDLIATNTMVFSISSASGTLQINGNVTGATSGATASSTYHTATQMMMYNISGTFQNGERVYITGQASTTYYVDLSNTGNPVIAVASVRSTDGTADTAAVTISGWTTDATHYIKIWTDPTTGARHNGKWDMTKYRLEMDPSTAMLALVGDYIYVDGLQFYRTGSISNDDPIIYIGHNSGHEYISNNIIRDDGGLGGNYSSIIQWGYDISCVVHVWNNLFLGGPGSSGGYKTAAIYTQYTDSELYAYNNTFIDAGYGIVNDDTNPASVVLAKNNIFYWYTYPAAGDFSAGTGYNTTDNASIGYTVSGGAVGDRTSQNFSFVDETNNDFHLTSSDTGARNYGTSTILWDANLSFTQDIDGSYRGAAWDIGADEVPTEFVSTVMESGGKYTNLSDWEADVQTDLTATSTRVFSGTQTLNIADGATVTLYRSGVSQGIIGDVVATTSSQILIDSIAGTTTPLVVRSGDLWRVDATHYWTVSGTLDQLGASPIAVAKIDGAWTASDTAAVTINGWMTSHDNYIKIYTAPTARHSGKWDTTKYVLVNTIYPLQIREENVRVDGLQIEVTDQTAQYPFAIEANSITGESDLYISNNIVRGLGNYNSVGYGAGIGITSVGTSSEARIWNNLVYNLAGSGNMACFMVDDSNVTAYLYNNTAYNCAYPYRQVSGTAILKNNISQVSSEIDGFIGTFAASSDFNISDIVGDSPNASFATTSKTVTFVSTSTGDFHLTSTDTAARDAGVSLASDPYLAFTTDIEGQARPGEIPALTWDIGADEYLPLRTIYRSVGPGATAALDTGSSTTLTIASTTSLATFGAEMADEIGVGDVIQYDSDNNGSLDALAFISGRASSTVYTVKTATGTPPTTTSAADSDWSIFRAYTSLANAEAGIENTGIVSGLRNFDDWEAGGDATADDVGRDLVTANEQWNIAAYANGAAADTETADINGWTTGEQNYIKIYTPVSTSEVGTSQRHVGKWDENKYKIVPALDSYPAHPISVADNYVRIEGLQAVIGSNSYDGCYGISIAGINSASEVWISDNIIKGDTGATYRSGGINIDEQGELTAKIFNNILYDVGSDGIFIYSYNPPTPGTVDFYNNTISNCSGDGLSQGYTSGTHLITAKNNIVQGCADGYYQIDTPGSDYNISDLAGDAPGSNSKNSTSVIFVDAANDDFHLAPSDTIAIDAGVNLYTVNYSDDFSIDPVSRWSSLYNDFEWYSNSFRSGTQNINAAVYNSSFGGATQYAKVDLVYQEYGVKGGVVLRSTGVASDGYYVVTCNGTNLAAEYWDAGGWADDYASTTSFTCVNGDAIAATVTGTGINTTFRIWKNPTKNTPISSEGWDSAGDTPDATLSLSGYGGSNFSNYGAYIGISASDDAMQLDDWYGGSLPDPSLNFNTDIDGQTRGQWDIGADEGSVEYVTSVMEAGGDFSTLSAWEAANQVDLATNTTAVFSISTTTGIISIGSSIVGLTSGAVASTTVGSSAASTSIQILLYNIASSTFISGERIYIRGGATTSNYAILSNAGNPAIATAKIDGAWTGADETPVVLNGFGDGPYNYIRIYTTPTARHNGKWDDSKYRLELWDNYTSYGAIQNEQAYSRIDGLQIYIGNSDFETSNDGINVIPGNPADVRVSNNIIHAAPSGTIHNTYGIHFGYSPDGTGKAARVWNNIIYGYVNGSNWDLGGIYIQGNWQYGYIYNNTIADSYMGIYTDSYYVTTVAKNNLVQVISNGYNGTFDSESDYNISNIADDTTGGGHDKGTTTVSFVDLANNDYHLSTSDTAAQNAGTSTILWDSNLSFTQDVDGSYRGAAWDIGADEVPTEFVSTICESTTAGGSCATMDKSTLASWEADVNSDLTATSTRVFSGSRTGSWADGATLTLYHGSTSTGITGIVVATTSSQILLQNISGTTTPVNVQNGDRWMFDGNNWWAASGTLDQLGASPIAVAKIDGAWASPETASVDITGWTTGADNYIKIYTTSAARHRGKYDTTKYRAEVTDNNVFRIDEDFVEVDGLQFATLAPTSPNGAIYINNINQNNTIKFSNNIYKGHNSPTYWQFGMQSDDSDVNLYAWNNVFYNIGSTSDALWLKGKRAYLYNNTLIGANRSIVLVDSATVAFVKNNISQGSINGFVAGGGSFNSSSDYNISDIAGNAPNATFATTSKTVTFVSTSTGDFHLSSTDTNARDQGVSLASDLYLAFSTDIDGQTRPGEIPALTWDIGADEYAPVRTIYRSVSPLSWGAIAVGTGNNLTIASTTSRATFASALPDNVGVGDAIQYDSDNNNSIDSIIFISGRISSTTFSVQTAAGGSPNNMSVADQNWSVFRPYTSLYNAEEGTENVDIDIAVRNFDSWSGGRDLVANNEQWNIAAYANDTTADTDVVTIAGWTTDSDNYLRIYTPTAATEVGTSQRHQGKWDDNKYHLEATNPGAAIIRNQANYVRIDGLQVKLTINTTGSSNTGIFNDAVGAESEVQISNNLVAGVISGATSGSAGINAMPQTSNDSNSTKIWNNVVYGFSNGAETSHSGILLDDGKMLCYNNTVYNSYTGIQQGSGADTIIIRNNLSYNYALNSSFIDYRYISATTSNNLSADATSPDATYQNKTVAFVDVAGSDFHLAPNDTSALDQGTSTPATDSNLSFNTDIDGQWRRQWDIGADEGSVEYVTSVMEAGGNFSTLSAWEAANQVDLATTSTAVFSLSSASGTIPANSSIMGLTSGAVASTTVGAYSTSTQILLYNIASSTFIGGERIYIRGGATTSNYAILSNYGNPAIATAKIDGVWTDTDSTNLGVNGWGTGPNNYVRIYTTTAARHNGKWDASKYRLEGSWVYGTGISAYSDFVRIDGLQVYNTATTDQPAGVTVSNNGSNQGEYQISNNIIRFDPIFSSSYQDGINAEIINQNTIVKIWNNIIYDAYAGIQATPWDTYPTANYYVFNNTVINPKNIGIDFAVRSSGPVGVLKLKNNLVQGSNTNYSFVYEENLATYDHSNNISVDNTSPDANLQNKTVSFADSAQSDFHLSTADTVAKDAGTASEYTWTQVASDNFNRANQNPMAGNWSSLPGLSGLRIVSSSSRAITTNTDNGSYWNADTFSDNQYSQITLSYTPTGSHWAGLLVRVVPEATRYSGYSIQVDGSVVYFYRINSTGGYSNLLTQWSDSFVSGDVLKMSIHNSGPSQVIRVWKNGVQIGSDLADSTYQSGGGPGIMVWESSSGMIMDDWVGGNVAGGENAYMPFTQDIDGSYRGAAWDIGADEVPTEFVSTICEDTGAGGDCANLNYNILSAWEADVNSDLTANTTRVFSGTRTGSFADGTTLTLYRNGSSTGDTAVAVATTSSQILLRNIVSDTAPLNVQSGDQWRYDGSNYWTASGTKDQLGASPIAIAKIDGAWANPDTTAVTITDWTTSYDNYIKIYTTALARHNGKWDDTKYRNVYSSGGGVANIRVNEGNVRIDGLQLRDNRQSQASLGAITLDFGSNSENADVRISNNILNATGATGGSSQSFGIELWSPTVSTQILRAWNNVIYDFNQAANNNNNGIWMSNNYGKIYAYNNTIYNCYGGISADGGARVYAKNNIVQNCTSGDCYKGTYATSSDYNISDIAGDSPNLTFATTSKIVSFINKATSSTYDFHLADNDTTAKGAGVNLYNDATSSVQNDIDSAARPTVASGLAWDIGADQTATKIYRSIAPGASVALSSGASNALSISSSTSLATFATALADNIGVGDVIIYNTSGTATGTAFIHGRSSSTVYTVKTASGTAPTAVIADTSWSIYRAYTTLANAEAGTENTGIANATIRNFDAWTGGADLVASNTQWNIAAYANGTTADGANTEINGWTTGAQNFIKIYTPYLTSEVGTSQRHFGKWDDNKYNISYSATGWQGIGIDVQANFTKIEGLQIDMRNASTYYVIGIFYSHQYTSDYGQVSNNIIRGVNITNTDQSTAGIYIDTYTSGTVHVWNNIVYGFGGTTAKGIQIRNAQSYVYNNTVYNCSVGYASLYNGNFNAINNIAQNTSNGFDIIEASSDYNISDIAGDAPGSHSATATVSFVDAANDDFHLAPTDTAALDAGTSTPATDTNLSFTDDIDGQLRRWSAQGGFDIGADEASVEYVTSVMESGGNFSTLSAWEAANQVDLATTSTAVFSLSSATGTIPANSSVMGLTSGAVASTTVGSLSTSTQILFYNIASSTFISGERIYIQGGATTSNYAILSNAGNPAIATAKIDGTWTNPDTTVVTIDGWMTGPTNYINIYTTAAARYNGKWDDGKYRLITNLQWNYPLIISEPYSRIIGLQIQNAYNNNDGENRNVSLSLDSNTGGEINFAHNLVKGPGDVGKTDVNNNGFEFGVGGNNGTAVVKIWNNIFYELYSGIQINIWSGMLGSAIVYNNSTINCYAEGISYAVEPTATGDKILRLKNNLSSGAGTTDYYTYGSANLNTYDHSNNISSDDTSPDGASYQDKVVAFVDAANNDFHLSPTDTVAKDAGTNLNADSSLGLGMTEGKDIDGSYRGAAFDIGADEVPTEFISTICENSSAGGDCATMDKSTLSAWESDVNSDLTATSTRVFSGARTGTWADGATLTLYRGATSTGVTGVVVATTSSQILLQSIAGTTTPLNVQNGDTWQLNGSNYWTASGTADQLGASPIAVAKIDGAWANPDTTAVAINGWTTSADNYVKIYTTATARHQGKWDDTKYRMDKNFSVSAGQMIDIFTNYVRISGLQLKLTSSLSNSSYAIRNVGSGEVNISDNIVNGILTGVGAGGGIAGQSSSAGMLKVWNNIVYGFVNGTTTSRGFANCDNGHGKNYFFDNTSYGNYYGFINACGSNGTFKNNISYNNTDNYSGSFNASSTYNISGPTQTDAPGSNQQNAKVVNFVSSTTGSEDFHLADTDTSARGAGVNLYNDANINVTNDIDSAARPATSTIGLNWDIGADQTATKIYRSIAPGASVALSSGASNALSISSSTSLATFTTALANNIGVGDVIIYNTGGTATATAFIHGRLSSTVYTVKTASGTLPTAVSADTSWSIYRAYTTLANAEAGIENSGIINDTIRNFDNWTAGGTAATDDVGKDIVTYNEQWNIAAYANGTTTDGEVSISGWSTGVQNYIKIYTPVLSVEVGASQRHQGKWDDSKYNISGINWTGGIVINVQNVRVDGIQIAMAATNGGDSKGIDDRVSDGSGMYISNNIIKLVGTPTGGLYYGIDMDGYTQGVNYVWNNLIYDIKYNNNQKAINVRGLSTYIYNNTIDNSDIGVQINFNGTYYVKNNLVQNSGDGFVNNGGSWDTSDYNISSIAGDAPNATFATTSKVVQFVDAANNDYHLAPTDTAALDAGTSTPATDTNLSFTDDIDGQARRQWDIGADEASVEYVTSVMESGGNFSTLSAWEAANQVDLATTTTAVFSLSSASGTIPANSSIIGLTSGAMASTTVGSVSTSTQILLYNIASSTFISGETVYIQGGSSASNYAIISNAGNPAIATAKIDGAWAGADETPFTFTGWSTGQTNYINIYTTTAARHQGKWDNDKYRLDGSYYLIVNEEDYVRFDGLQMKLTASGASWPVGISTRPDSPGKTSDIRISNNIIQADITGLSAGYAAAGIDAHSYASGGINHDGKLWNNIFYGWGNGSGSNDNAINLSFAGQDWEVYNNTIVNCENGIAGNSGVIAKNNLVKGSDDTIAYFGTFGVGTDYNATDGTDDIDQGTHNKISQTFAFVDEANEDFHLAPTDTAAKDAGVDLSTSTTSPFYVDIDGQARGAEATSSAGGLSWDIGADEGATIMYRSVGNYTGDLNSGAATVSIVNSTSSSLATFNSALATNVGVGDVIQYGSPLTLAFITGRSSSTEYSVVSATGSLPVATTTAAASIYRAHTLLNNWQTQTTATVNQSITAGLRSQVLVARDLVASNTAMFVTAYASSSPDTTTVTINTWTTGLRNYVKVYTPVSASEVGSSQRHAGKWDDTKFRLEIGSNTNGITISVPDATIEGMQIRYTSGAITGDKFAISTYLTSGTANVYVKNNILWGIARTSGTWLNGYGDYLSTATSGSVMVSNNVVYGFNAATNQVCIVGNKFTTYAYNNTVYGCYRGIQAYVNYVVISKNNISFNNTDNYYGTFSATSTNNLSGPTQTDAPGSNPQNAKVVNFLNTAASSTYDFHLAPTDRAARDTGVSLAADPYLPFTIDIDGQNRPGGTPPSGVWDIGADEDAGAVPDYRLNGNFKMNGWFKFR